MRLNQLREDFTDFYPTLKKLVQVRGRPIDDTALDKKLKAFTHLPEDLKAFLIARGVIYQSKDGTGWHINKNYIRFDKKDTYADGTPLARVREVSLW